MLREGRSPGPLAGKSLLFALGLALLLLLPAGVLPVSAGAPLREGALTSTGQLTIVSEDSRIASNSILATEVTVPSAPYPAGNASVLVSEPVTSALVIGIGLKIVSSGGAPTGYAFWQVWQSGTLVENVTNLTGPFVSGTQVTLKALGGSPKGWWNFTANGLRIAYGGNDGTDTSIASTVAAGFAAGASPVAVPTLSVTSSAASPGISLPVALWFFVHSRTILYPGDAHVVAASGMVAVGQNQNDSLPSDALEVQTNATPTASGTYLWGFGGPGYATLAPWTSAAASVFNNTGAGLNLSLVPSVSSAGDFCLALTEPLSTGTNLTLAYCSLGSQAITRVFLSLQFANGTSFQGEPVLPRSTTGFANLTLVSSGGGDWQAWFNGNLLSLPVTGANLTVGATLSSASYPPVAALTMGDGGQLSGVTNLTIGLLLSQGSGWYRASDGVSLASPSSAGACAYGNAQDWLVPPGGVELLPCANSLASGTPLWNATTPAPHLALTLQGLPSTLTSFETAPLRLFVNATTGSGSTPQSPALLAFAPTGLFGPAKLLTTGEYAVNLSIPMESATQSISFTLGAGAPGAYPDSIGGTITVGPGNLTLAYLPAPPSAVLDSENTTLTFWLNTSGTPSLGVPNGTFTASSSLGGSLTSILPLGPGEYRAVYTPPLVATPINDTINLDISAPGFLPLSTSVEVLVAPTPMTLAVAGLGSSVTAGSTVPVELWANTTAGTLPAVSWAALLGMPALRNVSILSNVTPGPSGGVMALLAFPTVPASNTTTLTLSATLFGYVSGNLTRPIRLTDQPLTVTATVPTGATGGASVPLSLTATTTNGTPVANVTISVTLPAGAGTLSSSPVTTDANGTAVLTWVPPTRGGSWTFQLSILGPAGYPSFAENSTVSVGAAHGGSAPTSGPFTEVVLFAVAVGGAVGILLLFGYLRARTRSKAAHPPARAARAEKTKKSEKTPPGL